MQSWEVLGQVAGLLGSVVILSYIEDHGTWQWVLGAWMAVQSMHVLLRFKSLQSIKLDTINVARAKLLAKCHTEGRPLSTAAQLSSAENFLVNWLTLEPRIEFGASIAQAFTPSVESMGFEEWVQLYQEDKYMLGWHDGQGFVALKEGAQGRDILKALYQCVLLNEAEIHSADINDLRLSLERTSGAFTDFIRSLEDSDWTIDKISIPSKPTRVQYLQMNERIR